MERLLSPFTRVRPFRIYHWDREKGANPTPDMFEIDRVQCGPMVLDALIKINDEISERKFVPGQGNIVYIFRPGNVGALIRAHAYRPAYPE